MKLRIKEEYKEFSIGGGRMNKVKLANLDPSLYQSLYDSGYSEFFYEEKPSKKTIIVEKEDNTENKED